MTRTGGSRTDTIALWCCLGAGFATLLDATSIAFTAPAVASSLDAATGGVQWYLAAYSLTFGLGLVPAGRLGDVLGRRGLLAGGLLLFVVGAVLSAASGDVWWLVAGRLVQGLGAGAVSAQVLGIIQDVFTGPARLRTLASYSAIGAVAAIVGPLIAGGVLGAVPPDPAWRIVLLLPVPFALATAWFASRLPRVRSARSTAPGIDIPGILLLGGFVVLITLPVIDPGLSPFAVAAILGGAALVIVALVVWEVGYARRGRAALFAPELMRQPGFVVGNLVALLWFGALLAEGTVTTVFFLQAHGIPALTVALVLVPGAFARIVGTRVSGPAYARLGSRSLVIGLVVQTVGIGLLALAAVFVDGWSLLIVFAVLQLPLGFAGGLSEPPLRAVTLGFAPVHLHGVAASFLQLTQRLSATFFVALTTGILLGVAARPTAASLQVAVVVCALASAVATVLALHPALHRGTVTRPRPSGVPWRIEEVAWDDPRAERLRADMDAEVGPRYADRYADIPAEDALRSRRAFAVDPDAIVATVLAVSAEGQAVGHAALRSLGDDLEVTRVYISPAARGLGASTAVMAALEGIARDRGAGRLILQTGDRQPEAVALYERLGYTPIPIFEPYLAHPHSKCFEKPLAAGTASQTETSRGTT